MPLGTGLSQATTPFYVAHRGGVVGGPGNSLAAYRSAVAFGAQHLEIDVRTLADGGLVIFHDNTVDASTNGTGAPASYTTGGITQLVYDSAGYPGLTEPQHPILLSEFLAEFGNRVILWIEPKDPTGDMPALIKALDDFGMSKDLCVVIGFQAASGTGMAMAKAAGYKIGVISESSSAWGNADYVIMAKEFTAQIAQAIGLGYKVLPYTVNGMADADDLLAVGVYGFMSDLWDYISGVRPALTHDAYYLQTNITGQLPLAGAGRWGYRAPNKIAIPNGTAGFSIQDWATPLPASGFTLEFDAVWGTSGVGTDCLSLFFGSTDRLFNTTAANTPGNKTYGYRIWLQQNANIRVFSYTDGTGSEIITGNQGTGALTPGTSIHYTITIDATSITIRANAFAPTTVVNSTYRPLVAFNFGSIGISEFEISNVSIDSGTNTNTLAEARNIAAYSAGTAYTLTGTAAALDFGTTDPAITFPIGGLYRLAGRVQIRGNGATIAGETLTLKLRKTSGTAADVSNSSTTIAPAAMATASTTVGVYETPPVYYRATKGDVVTIFGNVSAALGEGTLEATEAALVAEFAGN